MSVLPLLRWLPLVLAAVAIGYQFRATLATRAFARARRPELAAPEPVTLLKPLHGAEPHLTDNLASFLRQEWPAPIQLVAGTNRADDAALTVARALSGNVTVNAPAPPLGSNAKVSNLANLLAGARHDLLILSDSDMAVPPDYLARVAAALAKPGVGAVTCVYRGRADAGFWSRLFAAGIDYQFLPSVLVSDAIGVGDACMGSTIALRRSTLDTIGGFARFADALADDHALGAEVRALGLRVTLVRGLVLAHGCAEASFTALFRHELRWLVTLRAIGPGAHAGSLFTHALPLALLSAAITPVPGMVAVVAAFAARMVLAGAVDRLVGGRILRRALLPVRDCLSFVVFVASFFARSVDWRGTSLHVKGHGRIATGAETLQP